MSATAPLIDELNREAIATRRCLERVPEGRLGWRPHEKSLSLGQLALHVATNPAVVSGMMQAERMNVEDFPEDLYPAPGSSGELVPTLEESLAAARDALGAMSADDLMAPWTLASGGKELMTMPKAGVARVLLLNHWVHHRAQLGVYLRMLDVPVPSMYGPTADENPWMGG